MKRSEVDVYLRKLLNSDSISDESLNGLQVEGKEDIEKIGFAVSASEETFLKAKKMGCDAVIVHHGLFWKSKGVEPIAQVLKKRLSILLNSDINLFAFHLPLDCHPQIGNNARAALDLGLGNIKPFCEYHGIMIGFKGNFLEPVPLKNFIKKVEDYYSHKAILMPFGKKEIKSVGIVSGGAPNEVKQAAAEGLDLYITGEPLEGVYYLAKELEINMACLGHYATERVGVLALKNHMETVLNLKTEFIELKNPL
jgi:dinuclear metal center YbgI/SA1388 family protein